MKAFLSKYAFILIWGGAIVLAGGAFVFIVQVNMHFSPNPSPPQSQNTFASSPSLPPLPSITLTLETSGKNNSLLIQWGYLPTDTTALAIYRGKTGTDQSTWLLWQTLSINPSELNGGHANLDLGQSSLAGYSFYTEAITGGGNGGGNGSSTILWTSSTTIPTVTPPAPPSPSGNTPLPAGTPSSSPSSTPNNPPPAGNPQNGNGAPTTTPSGTPYYSPQVQISGYGQGESGNFWVQHIDQKIQIGWQDLPPNADTIQIFRSTDQNGPWSLVLTQQNPGVNGAYSIQVVDDTLGQPYYYEMNALAGGSLIVTYGPVYLAPESQ